MLQCCTTASGIVLPGLGLEAQGSRLKAASAGRPLTRFAIPRSPFAILIRHSPFAIAGGRLAKQPGLHTAQSLAAASHACPCSLEGGPWTAVTVTPTPRPAAGKELLRCGLWAVGCIAVVGSVGAVGAVGPRNRW